MSASDKLYFPTLDGLRFFAFLAVFIHHAPRSSSAVLAALHDAGFAGVSIFLCLSAFLLTSILKREFELSGTISIRRFFIRRALRIWPLYYAFLGAVLVWMLLGQGVRGSVALEFIQFGTFIENIAAGLNGYSKVPFSTHLWTISLEEQFYLVLPFALAIWLRDVAVAQRRLVLVWGLFIVARIGAVLMKMPHPFIWTSPFSADSIIIGTLLALRGATLDFRGLRGVVLVALGLTGTFAGAFLPPPHEVGFHQVVLYTAVGVGAGILCLAALQMDALRWLASAPLRYLGKISYGLYVFHLLGLFVAERVVMRFGLPPMLSGAIGLVVTIVVSAASYEVFERRFLAYKRRFESVATRPV